MKDRKTSAIRRGLSVMGKLLVGTRKGPSGERVRHLKKFQRKIGITFTDLGLLEQALTHRSYSHVTSQTRNESNERMEFLGDSVLGLAVSQFLYLQFPDRSEGALSKMKSLLVSRKVLSTVARDAGLGEFLLLSGEESEMGGRDRASILADSFEGVIGAIYLDQGFRAANKYIQKFLLAEIHEILKDEDHTNFKSLLQEHVQSKRLSHPVYRVRREEGPEHEKEFAIEVVVKGEVWGIGRGKSKKEAEQNAARSALERRQGKEVAPRRRGPREEEPSRRRSEAGPPRARIDEAPSRVRSDEAPSRARSDEAPSRARSDEAPSRPRSDEAQVRRRPDTPSPRAAERARPRDVTPTPPTHRGDHGIVASREQLRAARRAEAEQREQEELEGRNRREERRRVGESRRPPEGRKRRDRGPRPPTPPTMEGPPLEVEEAPSAISESSPAQGESSRAPLESPRAPMESPRVPSESSRAPRWPREPRGLEAPLPEPAGEAPVEPRVPQVPPVVAGPARSESYGRRRRSRRGGDGPRTPPDATRTPHPTLQVGPVAAPRSPAFPESRESSPEPARMDPEPVERSVEAPPAEAPAPMEFFSPPRTEQASVSMAVPPPDLHHEASSTSVEDETSAPGGEGVPHGAESFSRRKRKHGRGLRRR